MVSWSLTTPNHIRLIDACYPAAPLAAGPQFRPNSQELSRLTYYGSNRPGKLHKLSEELEKRAKNQARRAQAGNAKFKALLLVTLDILKALTAECRKDLNLFSNGVVNSVEVALACLPTDLEVIARAASTFTAWATYTDGSLLHSDKDLVETYLKILQTFSMMGVMDPQKSDDEFRSRKRLVGLAAISSAIQSDALFNTSSIFTDQVRVIVGGLLRIIGQADLSMLSTEATATDVYNASSSASPYIAEFQPQRPITQRRAPSIHLHVDGEKGPSFLDVVGAALRAFQTLVSHANAVQIPIALEALFNTFDTVQECGWENLDLCRWLVAKVADWTQYQYRYAIPTRLLSRLVDAKDDPKPTALHFALVTMITTVFTSPTPLINLSTSDVLASLLNVMTARLVIDPKDPLLPPLVDCVSSLGTHIYYADQLQDLAEELVARLVSIQVTGLLGRGRQGNDKGREEGMRCLIACLNGLFRVADEAHPPAPKLGVRKASDHRRVESGRFSGDSADVISLSKESTVDGRIGSPEIQRQRRNKVAPEVWQDTLALLCESEYAVRSDYASALVRFLKEEVKKEPFAVIPEKEKMDSASRSRKFATEQPDIVGPADSGVRFLNALHASAFTLALAPNLGLVSNAPSAASSSSLPALSPINIIPPTPSGTPRGETAPPNGITGEPEIVLDQQPTTTAQEPPHPIRRATPSGVRTRQASLGMSLLELPPSNIPVIPSPATLSDFSHLLQVLTAVHEALPARAILTGVPMLLALDAAVGSAGDSEDESVLHKRKAVREVVGRTWSTIAAIWDCPTLKDQTAKISVIFAKGSCLPPSEALSDTNFAQAGKQPVTFASTPYSAIDPSILSSPYLFNPEVVITALAQNAHVQKATGLDEAALRHRFTLSWSAEKAVKESIEVGICDDRVSRTDGASHFLKLSPALMHIDNQSLASLARTTRGVGVEELRDALEGRASMSNTNLASSAQSFSTNADHKSYRRLHDPGLGKLAVAGAAKQRKVTKSSPEEVADVLNKLGIGKQNPSRMLHTPLQVPQKEPESAPSKVLVPPYST
ncbi:plasma membrane localization protein [Tulasnella sp. 424]|nr:plasma membrane localization protein [Tulasnella sp. 424]KAG8981964.1 plasma membrane localization protein [Tulasnella sp. 425]